MLTIEQAQKLKIGPENYARHIFNLIKAGERESLQHPLQQAHFLTQILHESGNMRRTTENLNYSAGGLQRVFKKYFPDAETAEQYARNPKKIANLVYGNRKSLGNRGVESGDGWQFRGRGLIQLTGRNNYIKFFKWLLGLNWYINQKIINSVATDLAVDAAVYFWETRGLDRLAMEDNIRKITKKVNGSTHSVPERTELLNRVKAVVDFSEVTG